MPARVLLVEDDPSVRRFVGMALDQLDIDLALCASVESARDAMSTEPFDLVLTDLTLLDGSAIPFAEELAKADNIRVAVFSAGITVAVQRRLESANVWRILHKPVSVTALQTCVQDAIAVSSHTRTKTHVIPPSSLHDGFNGNTVMLQEFRISCLLQFPLDIATADLAVQSQDFAELQRIAHSLKTVLQLIGHEHAAQLAQALDRSIGEQHTERAREQWKVLREALIDID